MTGDRGVARCSLCEEHILIPEDEREQTTHESEWDGAALTRLRWLCPACGFFTRQTCTLTVHSA